MKQSVKHLLLSFLLGGLVVFSPSFLFAQEPLTVSKVIDGDTLKLSNGEKVRLIGIDTPESSDNPKTRRDSTRTGQDMKDIIKMGKEAAEFTRKLVEGKKVRLEYDVQKKDKYGRTLAYVFIDTKLREKELIVKGAWYERIAYYVIYKEHRSLFVNATIMRAGYAQAMTIPPNVKYQELFVKLEKEAREQKRGLWG